MDWISNELKGKKAPAIKQFLIDTYQLKLDQLSSVTSQTAAKDFILEIIDKLPEENFHYDWEYLPTGISNTVTPMFPEAIYIPAVKDFSDEIKSKESTSFGKLIKILFNQIENSLNFTKFKNHLINLIKC